MGESPRVRFVLDMYDIGDRPLEGIKCNVEVDTRTNEVKIDYATPEDREYVEGLGAPGTADYWLREAKEILEEEWEAFYPA